MRAGRRARSCAGLRKSDEGCAEQNGSDDQEIWHESPTSGVDVRGNPDPTCSVPLGRRRGCAARADARFAADSALEGSEFELPVPRSMQGRSNAIIAASAACHRRPIVCGCRRRTSAKAGQSEISEPKPYRVRNRKMLWGGRRGKVATSSLHLTDGVAAMPQPNDPGLRRGRL